jgi:hypothetical protein
VSDSIPNPEMDAQKRRTTRIVQAVPLTVTGIDALGRTFQERTSTLIINCHGCRYQSKHYVLKNMWVTLEVPHNEPGHDPRVVRARVTWIQRPRTVRELFQVGVELEVTGNIWGIAFPPADWFLFPESTPLPATTAEEESTSPERPAAEWEPEAAPSPEPAAIEENNVRVLPLPGGTEEPVQFAKQITRLGVEAKQEMQNTVRETATRVVAGETRPLLAALQGQLKDAAEKSVEAAVAAHFERMQRDARELLQGEREASLAALRAEWSREVDRRIADARQQIDAQLGEVERARQTEFEQQIQSQILSASDRLASLKGSLGANAEDTLGVIEQMRQSSEEAAAAEIRRWQELTSASESEADARLTRLERVAKELKDQLAAVTSAKESGGKSTPETDLAPANARWNQQIEPLLEGAARQASERITRESEVYLRGLEDQLQQRIRALGAAFSQATAEAESTLANLRASISGEAERVQAALSQIQRAAEKMEMQRNEFSALIQSGSEDLAQRSQALLAEQVNEMHRREEAAVAGMAARLQPALESAGQDTIERLARELEQRLAPQVARASEVLSRLAFEQGRVEKALAEHQQQLWHASERTVQESVTRAKNVLAEVEKDYLESARAAGAKWLTELEAKAMETTHSTFEALFKSADWYEKKVQTQMQAALENGLEQAGADLREKAGEMSSLFASELDHYSRSYVEHARGQMDDHAREAAERASQQMLQASDNAAADFAKRSDQLAREQSESLTAKANAAFDQNAARIDTYAAQVRAKLESDARSLAGEFQRVLVQQTRNGLAQGKQELTSQLDQAKDSLRTEGQILERQLQVSAQSLQMKAMEDYKQRLENASSTWLLTTVTRLNQQSQGLIDQLAVSAEKKLRATCNTVFAEMGETLRQRLATISVSLAEPTKPAPPPITPNPKP